jgi:DNA-directed RNA polymerase specialized sigma24 family protein
MTSLPALRALPLDELSLGCAQEIENFRKHAERAIGYCFEIFRRAISDADERAWAIFAERCQTQVQRWAQRHSGFARCGEPLEDVVTEAFAKLWQSFAMDQAKIGRFATFPALMLYLKMCVNSAIVDALRMRQSAGDELTDMEPAPPAPPDQRAELWNYIASRLKDDKERTVVRAFFLYGQTPRDLLKQFPNRFEGVAEIYRIKQNVTARLRRDAEFRERFGDA